MNFPNYPQILKIFYRYSFPDQLGAAGTSLAHALIYKANDLYFPPSFKMSNIELCHLSGVLINNIGRTRQKVLEVCVFDGVPMFTYVDNGKRMAGEYTINYFILSTRLQLDIKQTSDSRQKQGKIDNDHNSTQPNSIKIPPTPPNISTKQELPEDAQRDVDDIVEFLEKKFSVSGKLPEDEVVSMYLEYGKGVLREAIKAAKPNSKRWKGILSYINITAQGIKNGGNGGGAKLDDLESDLQKLEYELEVAYKDNSNPEWIVQQEEKAARLREMIGKVTDR